MKKLIVTISLESIYNGLNWMASCRVQRECETYDIYTLPKKPDKHYISSKIDVQTYQSSNILPENRNKE